MLIFVFKAALFIYTFVINTYNTESRKRDNLKVKKNNTHFVVYLNLPNSYSLSIVGCLRDKYRMFRSRPVCTFGAL